VVPISFAGDPGLEGGTLDSGGDALDHLAVEDARHDIFGAEFTRRNTLGDGSRRLLASCSP